MKSASRRAKLPKKEPESFKYIAIAGERQPFRGGLQVFAASMKVGHFLDTSFLQKDEYTIDPKDLLKVTIRGIYS